MLTGLAVTMVDPEELWGRFEPELRKGRKYRPSQASGDFLRRGSTRAVAAERLADYLRALREFFEDYDYQGISTIREEAWRHRH